MLLHLTCRQSVDAGDDDGAYGYNLAEVGQGLDLSGQTEAVRVKDRQTYCNNIESKGQGWTKVISRQNAGRY